ncbi:ABC-F family ATP-binding cassette domain-containing protein [Lacticaseibacillus saniviri]|uniref:ABC transporter ATPase n=2 Tax=Lacticaseibacillus saniviri TaxID=931533 RepID=A0A0R2N0K0_9LACO|nr:ABC-F family ATP-binding cassette domain-containing protein [Lacticaseibacillus saniviri]KRO18274.1 ABC transporter ATPase [Lacticaseibacillus saniviri JCM 17471 = DSM 24301]
MQTLTASGLSKAYGDKQLFSNIDFLINEGDRIGLIGVNGTGKTTLLNGLAGIDPFDAGELSMPKNYQIRYLAQQPSLPSDSLIMDAIYGGSSPIFAAIRQYETALAAYTANPMDQAATAAYEKADATMTQLDAWQADTDIKTILTQLHIDDLNQRIGTLSGGQQKRVGLAQVLIEQPDLLILDEPTNHLDFDSIDWLEKFLARYQGALLVVTHDRYFLDRVSNTIFELDQGRLFRYSGNYEAYVQQKAEQVEQDANASHKQQQLYKQELAWMHAGAQARSTKQNARINRFNELSDEIKGQPGKLGQVDIQIKSARLGKKVIEMAHADLTLGDHPILRDFSWLVQPNQRIGITGQNGAGKSSLLNVIAGKLPLDNGVVEIGETVKLGYYTQMSQSLDDSQRVINYLQTVGEGVVSSTGDHISVTQLLEQFLFPRSMHGNLIGRLSGGEKRRLYLLQILMQEPNVLLLDEPTNDLDVATLTVLEDYLDHFAGTVITVSHDRYFLDKVADTLLIFEGNAQIERYTGQFSDYLKTAGQKTATKKTPATAPQAEATPAAPKEKTKLTYAEQMEYDQLQPKMDAVEAKMDQIKADMAADDGADYVKLASQQKEMDELSAEFDQLFERFAELDDYVSGE